MRYTRRQKWLNFSVDVVGLIKRKPQFQEIQNFHLRNVIPATNLIPDARQHPTWQSTFDKRRKTGFDAFAEGHDWINQF